MTTSRLLALTASAMLISCCAAGRCAPVIATQAIDRVKAGELAVRADDARRLAFGGGEAAGLSLVFRGRALLALHAQVQAMRGRGERIVEREPVRTLLFWDPRAREAVLEVAAQHRLITPTQPDPAWAATVRQWWSRLDYQGSTWWIVDQQDLAPTGWRSKPAAA